MAGPAGDVRVAFLTHPTIRNTDPNLDDWGVVARIIASSPLVVQEARPNVATKSSVTPLTMPAGGGPVAGTLLAPANPSSGSPLFSGGRRGFLVFNNSQVKFLYLSFVTGPAAPPVPPPPATMISQSDFTLRLAPQSEYVMPFPMFLGYIFGAFGPSTSSDTAPFGNVLVTELT